MTKLEELKAARDAAWATYEGVYYPSFLHDAGYDTVWGSGYANAWGAVVDTRKAYEDELKKTQEETKDENR